MAKFIYEVLEEVRKKRSKKDKIEVLKANETWALKDVIRGSMDSTVEWNLPPGEPPYTPCEPHSAPANLLRENKKFGYFVKGGPGDKLPSFKRESIFMGLIEGVHPEDAKLVIGMINKQTPDGLSRPIINDAFPGLLKD
jgi:hypothetical protein